MKKNEKLTWQMKTFSHTGKFSSSPLFYCRKVASKTVLGNSMLKIWLELGTISIAGDLWAAVQKLPFTQKTELARKYIELIKAFIDKLQVQIVYFYLYVLE